MDIMLPLREKCPNTELFLVRILPHSDWIWRDTTYLSVFSLNAGKYGPEITLYLDIFHAVYLKLYWRFFQLKLLQMLAGLDSSNIQLSNIKNIMNKETMKIWFYTWRMQIWFYTKNLPKRQNCEETEWKIYNVQYFTILLDYCF